MQALKLLRNHIFGSYWSISPDRFNQRCETIGYNPEKCKQKFLDCKLIRVIANEHIESI